MVSTDTLQNQSWANTEENALSEESLNALLNNEIPNIRIKNFASHDECEMLARNARSHGFDYYENVVPKIGRIGITQFEHKANKHAYFNKAENANKTLDKLCEGTVHPIKRLAARISSETKHSLTRGRDGSGEYFAGLIRQINQALLHIDFGPFDGPEWEIGKIDAQLAWNLYLTPVKNGGECLVYNRPWLEMDDVHKVKNSYAYDHNVVEGSEVMALKPIVGDLVLHNSRNYHEVRQGEGERLTISSFIGRYPSTNKLFAWS